MLGTISKIVKHATPMIVKQTHTKAKLIVDTGKQYFSQDADKSQHPLLRDPACDRNLNSRIYENPYGIPEQINEKNLKEAINNNQCKMIDGLHTERFKNDFEKEKGRLLELSKNNPGMSFAVVYREDAIRLIRMVAGIKIFYLKNDK